MAKFIDYYKILGVEKNIAQDKIKAAYRKRSKQFHPDLHPDDPKAKAKFQMLNEAYEVLNDPKKRALYDQYGEHWDKMGGAGAQGGGFGGFNPFGGGRGGAQGDPFGGFEFNMGGGGFSDFFSELFGGRARQGGSNPFTSQQPKDEEVSIDIDMYTALLGGEVIIQSGTKKFKIKLKPSTQPGTKMRMRGKGDGGRDLIITINVRFPETLSDRQRELLVQMKDA